MIRTHVLFLLILKSYSIGGNRLLSEIQESVNKSVLLEQSHDRSLTKQSSTYSGFITHMNYYCISLKHYIL